jgi:hypothetical protein
LKLALGALLLLFGAQEWRRRPKDPSQAQLPKWMAAIDRFTPPKILVLGLVISAANAKNAPDHRRRGLGQLGRNPRPGADRDARHIRDHSHPSG